MGPPRARCRGWGQFCNAAVWNWGRTPWHVTGEPIRRYKTYGTSRWHLEVSPHPRAGLIPASTWAGARASAWLRLAVIDGTRYGGSSAYSSAAHQTGWVSVWIPATDPQHTHAHTDTAKQSGPGEHKPNLSPKTEFKHPSAKHLFSSWSHA